MSDAKAYSASAILCRSALRTELRCVPSIMSRRSVPRSARITSLKLAQRCGRTVKSSGVNPVASAGLPARADVSCAWRRSARGSANGAAASGCAGAPSLAAIVRSLWPPSVHSSWRLSATAACALSRLSRRRAASRAPVSASCAAARAHSFAATSTAKRSDTLSWWSTARSFRASSRSASERAKAAWSAAPAETPRRRRQKRSASRTTRWYSVAETLAGRSSDAGSLKSAASSSGRSASQGSSRS